MKKRIVVAVVLAVLMAASAYAQTPDFFALVKNGTPQDVQAAIKKGADVNAGADIKAVDNKGATPLMLAAWRNQNPQVVSTLLKAGADGKVKDYDGKTAFDHAQSNTKFRGTDALEKLEEAAK